MTIDAVTITTPVGNLALLAREDIVVAAGFAPIDQLVARLPTEEFVVRRDLGSLSAAVAAYFDGDLTAMDDLAVMQPGGDFHQACWEAMRKVKAGETVTYTELADLAGNQRAFRAAAAACARNLIAPIVPCHRILRTDGTPGGYYYGLDKKEWLLVHEQKRLRNLESCPNSPSPSFFPPDPVKPPIDC